MKMLTLQEVFDKAALGLLKQNERSTADRKTNPIHAQCLYRGANGMKCAAGFLITDEMYEKYGAGDLEGGSVNNSLEVQKALMESGVDMLHTSRDLVGRLQYIHDSELPEKWAHELQITADMYHLTMPEIPA